jgi:hypothetical protein
MSTDTDETPKAETTKVKRKPKPRENRRRGRAGLGTILTLTVAGLVFVALFLSVSGRSVPVPAVLQSSIEDRVNARLDGAPLSLGGMRFAIGRDGVPQVLMQNIRLSDPAGGGVAYLNSLGAELSLDRLLRGDIAASSLILAGAQITIRRTRDGTFAFRSDQLTETEAETLPELLETLDQILATPALAALEEVQGGGIVLTLEDARSGRIWQATNATTTLRKTSEGLSVSVVSDVFNGTDEVAGLQMSLSRNRVSGNVSLGMQVTDMLAADIALQAPVVSFLSVLDAPMSGAVRAELDQTGQLTSFAGTLDIVDGALMPAEDVPPVQFDAAQLYFTFDPASQRIDFSQLAFTGADGDLVATGHTYLTDFVGPWPGAFLTQLQVERLAYAGGDMFPNPVEFDDIRADYRLRLDPFTVEIGQVVIDNQGTPVTASGRVEARDGQWRASIDAQTDQIDADRVLALWPLKVSPVTRGWLSENLKTGRVVKPSAAIRYQSGDTPDLALSFAFEDGETSFLKALPPLTKVSGRASMLDHAFVLSIDEGGVTSGTGEWIDAGGSVFRVDDVRPKPSWGTIEIAAQSSLPAILTVLDNPPFRIMERAGRTPDIAAANAVARAVVKLPLKDGVLTEEVTYDVTARLSDVRSDRLVDNRVLTAEALALKADQDGIGIDGNVRLDGVPLSARWQQGFGDGADNGRIEGTVELSADAMTVFDVPLPQGLIRGQATAQYDLALPREGPARLTLTSNLTGVSMALPQVNWQKAAASSGELVARATLSEVPVVEELSISAPGLRLAGRLNFNEAGFQSATFDDVRIDDWLNAELSLKPGRNGTAVALTGGTFDLRRFESGSGSGGGGNDGSGGAIDIALDRLIVSDSITLSPIRGRMTPSRFGLSGDFEARVNGGALIRGNLSPANGGTAVRIQAANAAAVIRDAGLTPNARNGTLDVVLTPVSGARSGTYNGQFLIESMRLRKAPLMAGLLDAISVVGLLDQLDGPGINFSSIDGRFRLTPRRLQILEAAAVGPSIGISADGIYDFVSKDLDMRGVISPVYFLNGIGSIFTRRGEGLFGFNYRVSGAVERPRIGVNPLSIFTPGMFRQIFRSAPPEG